MLAGNRQHTCDSSVKSNQKHMQMKVSRCLPKYMHSLYVLCLWQPCGLTFCTSRGLLLTEWCHDAKNCRESLLIYYSLTERTPHPHLRAEQLLTSHPKSTPTPTCAAGCMCRLCVGSVNRGGTCSNTCMTVCLFLSLSELDKHLCHLDSMRSWSKTTVAPPGKALKNQRR